MNDYQLSQDRPRSGLIGFVSYGNGTGAMIRDLK
jgi:hypothetical protein